MSEQWGPWIDHDGKGCPCLGMYVRTVNNNGVIDEGIATALGWGWRPNSIATITIYRIRKPRALQDLIKLVEELPEGVDA